MWQDSLALLIVAGAGVWLARDYMLGFWRRCTGHPPHEKPAASGGCSSCGSGSSCALARIKAPQAN
ncbi:MAG: hypothetical protein WAW42_09120 [Candidatus Competibacteraceae bacterium]